MTTEARIPEPAPGELRADVEALLPLIARPGGKPASTMVVLARSPDLLSPFLGWAAALALNGVLSNRDHELLALRAAANCGSAFEWDEHVEYARNAGLTDVEIESVPKAIEVGSWTEAERALLRAADELHTTHDVSGTDVGRTRRALRRAGTRRDPVRRRSVHDALDGRERRRHHLLINASTTARRGAARARASGRGSPDRRPSPATGPRGS